MSSVFHQRMGGKLLGDGCIVQQSRRKPRFQFIHRRQDEQWALYCYEQLKAYIPLAIPFPRKTIDSRVRDGFTESIMVQSRTHPAITDLRALWYPGGVKRLPVTYITEHLTEEALAWWYQDDGHLNIQNGNMRKIILSTDNFTTEENEWLVQLLYHKFQLKFSIDAQNRLLLYDQSQIMYFLNLVAPHLQPCMNRKAAQLPPLKTMATRTTVYLPECLRLSQPTREINEQLHKLPLLTPGTHCTKEINALIRRVLALRALEQPTRGYQLAISPIHQLPLASIQQVTGATIGEMIALCFGLAAAEKV